MTPVTRLLSSLLLAAGMVLVFAGLSSALGFTLPGMAASVAVIAGLLYAGAVWFGAPPMMPAADGGTVVVFDRHLRAVAGALPGTSIVARYPEAVRADIERHCRAALAGESSHFTCQIDGARVTFEAAPVLSANGLVLFGVLVSGAGIAAPLIAQRQAATA